MLYDIPRFPPRERAVLVGVVTENRTRRETEEHLQEMALLAKTARADIIEKIIQVRHSINSSLYIGKGKVYEILEILHNNNGNVVIFDDELSPGQVKNIQDILKVKVIDRTNLILDIFARHARTKRSKIQVELAQLQYLLPRLTSAWTHFGQQTGGIGTRGPGETQLESDRRAVQKRISDLRKRLKKFEKIEQEQRKRRKNAKQVCLIGYTNAGKSSLINVLTKENVKAENMLFSTLDTTTRKLYLEDAGNVLISDTVGFIHKLPIHLIESFLTTLNVAMEASLLVHVVDASVDNFEHHIKVVTDTLKQLEISDIPRLMIFNKIDLCGNNGRLLQLSRLYPDAFMVSTKTSDGIPETKRMMSKILLKE